MGRQGNISPVFFVRYKYRSYQQIKLFVDFLRVGGFQSSVTARRY
jgi:hypothetical protein